MGKSGNKNILLIEPPFPVAAKSKNHAYFLPIGLLKIGAYHAAQGNRVKLIRGNTTAPFVPHKIMITTLFTYWSKYVHESVEYYRSKYPRAEIEVGGIYATLIPKDAAKSGAKVHVGLHKEAEKFEPDYGLLPDPVDYQIIHASRGCMRECSFCGVWRIEPKRTHEKSILSKIKKRKLVFYDNNLLANPHIEGILKELEEFRFPDRRHVTCESQSGFDGRILRKQPHLAKLLKAAHFQNPRIAWDGRYETAYQIKEMLEIFKDVGYKAEELFVFMLYNHDLDFGEMSQKLDQCRRWGVRVIDCRYRPLDQTFDNYNPRAKEQTNKEYYIHVKWSDSRVRAFRRKVRRQNIAIILHLPHNRYIEGCERGYVRV